MSGPKVALIASSPRVGALTETPSDRFKRRALKHRGFVLGASIVGLIFLVAIAAQWIAPFDPYDQNLANRLINPVWYPDGSWIHPLGTDKFGRDYLSRLIYGARISLLIGFVTMIFSGTIGTVMGLTAGYFGGRVDAFVMYLVTVRLSLPVVLVALAPIRRLLAMGRPFSWRKIDPLGAALGLTLLILAFSGTARGETGRVWLFFVPFILVVAARRIRQCPSTIMITLAQAVTLFVLAAFLRVVDTELVPPPTEPPVIQGNAGDETSMTPVTFANSFTLIGQHGAFRDGGIDLTLTWRSDQQVAYPYYFSALIVGPDGKPIPPAVVWQPFNTAYPLTCWRPGQVLSETRHLPLSDLPPKPGDYWISLSAFPILDNKEQSAVTVIQQGTAPDTQVGIGPITLP